MTRGLTSPATLMRVALVLAAGCGSGAPSVVPDAGNPEAGVSQIGGQAMCGTCFVHGRWQVDNVSPCFVSVTSNAPGGATLTGVVSTTMSGGTIMCPAESTAPPAAPWSTDTLTTDCSGRYKLCVTLKAGKGADPQPTDCTLAQSCAEDDYKTPGQPQKWADLPGWLASAADLPCAQRFRDSGGYALMTATGAADDCGLISRTMGVISFCPLSCMSNPQSAECANCKSGGTGEF